ncbi:MAG: sulfite exporter TauE/SafE family protein [Candidatus Kapaibacterium sp.]
MYFPEAGIYVDWWLPPLAAFLISSLTSAGGVSGAFLLLPYQVSFLGYTAPSVSATNQLYNVIAIPGGVIRYIREGRMVWPLAGIIAAGSVPGVLAGALIRINWLDDPSDFKKFAALVLLYIAFRLVRDIFKKDTAEKEQDLIFRQKMKDRSVRSLKTESFSKTDLEFSFYGEPYRMNVPAVFLISFVVGIAGGAYGIGGGAIIAPLLIVLYRLPVYIIAGAALISTMATSFTAVAFFQLLAAFYPEKSVSPDWLLGLLFGLGGLAGVYFGAVVQKYLPSLIIKIIIAISMILLAARYIFMND